jgi:hypothetical protein
MVPSSMDGVRLHWAPILLGANMGLQITTETVCIQQILSESGSCICTPQYLLLFSLKYSKVVQWQYHS